MDQATQLWLWWQALLDVFSTVFTRPGWIRLVQWVTGMVLQAVGTAIPPPARPLYRCGAKTANDARQPLTTWKIANETVELRFDAYSQRPEAVVDDA